MNEITNLPDLSIDLISKVNGSNIDQFKSSVKTVIDSFGTELTTDSDFAQADTNKKLCASIEEKITKAEALVLESMDSVNAVIKTLRSLKEDARQTRLSLEKLVKSRKEAIKQEVIDKFDKKFDVFFQEKNADNLGLSFANWKDCLKNLKTIDSVNKALEKEFEARKKTVTDAVEQRKKKLEYIDGNNFDFPISNIDYLLKLPFDEMVANLLQQEKSFKEASLRVAQQEVKKEITEPANFLHESTNNDGLNVKKETVARDKLIELIVNNTNYSSVAATKWIMKAASQIEESKWHQ